MPYITKDQRAKLDTHILGLVEAIYEIAHPESEGPTDNVLPELKTVPGLVNYSITALLKSIYDQRDSYANFNAQIGTLECCKLELYRKLAAPYEDQKEYENGAVVPLYIDTINKQ